MSSFLLPDQKAREEALDTSRSFIVQAPAGSGKTELLTRRFLALLATVERPEQILALTFTRKAAAEMRERIIRALNNANSNTALDLIVEPNSLAFLAKQALQQNDRYQWRLLEQSDRLQIMTIDAFNSYLVQRMPLNTRLINYRITEQPQVLYQRVIRALLRDIDQATNWRDYFYKLLVHFDNRLDIVEKLFIDLLAKREQWIPYLMAAHQDIESLRKVLEEKLNNFLSSVLRRIEENFPENCRPEFLQCWHLAVQYANNPAWHVFDEENSWPTAGLDNEKIWRTLADFLLTKDGQWRSSQGLKASLGFPAPSGAKDAALKAQYQQHKNLMASVLEQLSNQPNLLLTLQDLQSFPSPRYSDEQWQICLSILHLLPTLLAYLQVEIQYSGDLDYSELSLNALRALGEVESPTDLALVLDNKLQHILIDEFQDTSLAQYHLLLLLIAGWQVNDGRTLFLVGDPQQSIYRFRKAEVGLFLRIWREGLANFPLTPLQLTANFRSSENLVSWINVAFANIFPKIADIAHGGVPLSVAYAANKQCEEVAVHFIQKDAQELTEQTLIETIIQEKIKSPEASIAILVRAKRHLDRLLPLLQEAQIAYDASDLDSLLSYSLIHDLLILTKALLRLEDRLSWLSLLRTPWINLSLVDMQCLLEGQGDIVFECISQWHKQPGGIQNSISPAGKYKLLGLYELFTKALTARRRINFDQLVYKTWQQLESKEDEPSHLTQQLSLKFFNVLRQCLKNNDLTEITLLENLLATITLTGEAVAGAVKIMSIHKAKGLEFDIVIVPGIERGTAYDDPALILFDEIIASHGQEGWVMAPLKALGAKEDDHYQWLKKLIQKKAEYERQRLLYVACTRAKRKLYLLATHKNDETPRRGSFLADLLSTR